METIPRSPIVDTGPLFDFLLWRFSESFKIPSLLSKLRYLNNESYRKSVSWYFRVAKPITTCPEVIAEVHRLAKEKLREGEKVKLGHFWRFAQQELKELGLSEELVQLVQMDSDTLSSLGPTDTALLEIASSTPNLHQPILTEDGPLTGLCRKKQVRFLRIAEVLSIWQRFASK